MWLLLIVGIIPIVASNSGHHTVLQTVQAGHRTALKAVEAGPQNRTDVNGVKQTDVVEYDLNIDPITHLEMIKQTIEMDRRIRRNPDSRSFDRGYDKFLRNYRRDNGGGVDRRDNYKVKDSEEERSESNENDYDDDSGDDDDEETSDERPKQSKRVKNIDDDYDRIKQESSKTKKSKHCKTEKRGSMVCNVCHNPKTDEKSESCKSNADPNDKKYAYSNEKKYSHKQSDDDRESFEEAREFTTKRPLRHNGPPHVNGPPPFNVPRPYNNRYPINPIPAQITYRRVTRPTVPYSYIRYRSNGPRPQRIRIITLPGPPPPPFPPPAPVTPLPSAQFKQRSFPITVLDTRPQRDTGWLQNRRPYSEQLVVPQSESKLHEIEILPEHFNKNTDGEFAEFLSKDWSKCRKFTEGELLCFECGQKKGSKNKECMFSTNTKPEESRQAYAKSNVFDYEKNSDEPVKKPSPRGGRRAKIHPAWQTSADTESNFQKEAKSIINRKSKLSDNLETKVPDESHGAEANSKPKANARFYKFNNDTKLY